MNQKLFYLMIPLLLTGCVGTWISGNTGYLDETYPDIRTVPEREEASKSRGLHTGNEKTSRAKDFKKLEQDRAKIKARDEALREEFFPEARNEEFVLEEFREEFIPEVPKKEFVPEEFKEEFVPDTSGQIEN